MSISNMKNFKALDVDLEGKNLVEASAGTGKTYAIGLLLLRLLLEKKIRIDNILVVTFTNAAVAELDIRIRKFLNESLKIALGHVEKPDDQLKEIVDKSIQYNGERETITLLKHAALHLDETSIFTIHSFCQNTLSDNAFESRLLFNTEIMEDQSSLTELAATDHWRKHITSLDTPILDLLINKKFSIELISEIFHKMLDGRKLRVLNGISPENITVEISKYTERLEAANNDLMQAIINNWPEIQKCRIGKSKLKQRIDEGSQTGAFEEFLILFRKNPFGRNVVKLDFLQQFADNVITAEQYFERFKTDLLVHYLKEAVDKIGLEISRRKNRNKVFSFQDLIDTLHTALVKNNNSELKEKLNKKYKAVFIDEFQDTDRLQYEIFKKAFIDDSNAILFLIGDPKQSIYAWRGADLHTYHDAKKVPGCNLYTMNRNYRSSPPFIDAVNEFFRKDIPGSGADENPLYGLNYRYVDAANTSSGKVKRHGKPASSFTVIDNHHSGSGKTHAKEIIFNSAAGQVIDLMENHTILADGSERKVKPQDIGVLVRYNNHAREMKEELSKYGIPAIIVDDTRVIETAEATQLFHLLYAMINIDTGSINRALMSDFTGYSHKDIEKLNTDIHKDIFMKLHETWKKSGIYAAISEFINIYDVRTHLIFGDNQRGDRIYTNLIQLTQILNEKETYDAMSSLRLLDWFQKARQGDRTLNKYEQQLESDEDSVKITTVHKSKGLQYNFVVLPYFNLKSENKNKDYITYRSDGEYQISFYQDTDETDLMLREETEENRRLLYVAVTRAVYKCVIHHYNSNIEGAILNEYIENIRPDSQNIEFRVPDEIPLNYRFEERQAYQLEMKERQFSGYIDSSWRITSYSGLYTTQDRGKIIVNTPEASGNDYDEFIFSKLPKGAQTGLLVHELMEIIEYDNSNYHSRHLAYLLGKYGRSRDEKDLHNYKVMLENILEAGILPSDIRLSQIHKTKRITELEFYFSFDRWSNSKVKSLLPDTDLTDQDISGIMHGFVDLVFECNGRYYILDWKTNHLGNSLDDYSAEKLAANILENKYHLQYITYILALKRYLQKKISGFSFSEHFGGVIYAYIRGMRKNSDSGIFFDKPGEKIIDGFEEMTGVV